MPLEGANERYKIKKILTEKEVDVTQLGYFRYALHWFATDYFPLDAT